MKLAKGEEIFKEWEYAQEKRWFKTSHMKLTVTNKRIVSDVRGMNKTERKEIPISLARGVDVVHKKPSLFGVIFWIVIGSFFCLSGIMSIAQAQDYTPMLLYGLICIVLGVLIILKGVKNLKKGSVSIVVRTDGAEGSPLAAGANSLFVNKQFRVKLFVDHEAAEDIVESLGLIIMYYGKTFQ